MKIHKNSIILSLAFSLNGPFITGCATSGPTKDAQDWLKLKNTDTYQNEKALYRERMNDFDFCWGVGVDDFLKKNSPKPNKKCIYPTSKFIVAKNDSSFGKKNVLQQNFKQLKVLQVANDGFVIQSPNFRNDKVLLIKKTSEKNIVDGSFLDETQNWQVYVYLGVRTYNTLLGSKTVHSFKQLTKEQLENAKKGLKLYRPTRDFFLENKLWSFIDKPPKK